MMPIPLIVNEKSLNWGENYRFVQILPLGNNRVVAGLLFIFENKKY
jgi:hypothetical protein